MKRAQLATILSTLPYHGLHYVLHVHWYPPPKLFSEDLLWRNEQQVSMLLVELYCRFPSLQLSTCFACIQTLRKIIIVLRWSLELVKFSDLYFGSLFYKVPVRSVAGAKPSLAARTWQYAVIFPAARYICGAFDLLSNPKFCAGFLD